MTKANKIYNSNEPLKAKYNKLLDMWEHGVNYSFENELTQEQYKRFAEIPKLLSKLLNLIEPDTKKRTVREVFEGFEI